MGTKEAIAMRDMDAQPYSVDEQRVADWIVDRLSIGCGDDPIGFLLAACDLANARQQTLTVKEAIEHG